MGVKQIWEVGQSSTKGGSQFADLMRLRIRS